MGIRFYCPNGHKLNVKEFQAGLRGVCPYCGEKIQIPAESTRPPSKKRKKTTAATPETSATAETPASVAAKSIPVAQPTQMPNAWAPGNPPASEPQAGSPEYGAATAQPRSSPVVVPGGPPEAAPIGTVRPGPPPAQPPLAPPQPADPLAEGGDVVWYVRPASGGQFGPAGPDIVRTWLAEGRISVDTLVWREGWRDWQEASQVFPHLAAGRVESPLAGTSAGETTATTTTASTTTGSRRIPRGRKSENARAIVIIVLIFVVLVLSGVFIWVLNRDPGGRPDTAAGLRPAAVSALEFHTRAGP